jgi:hypothetical protein
MLLATRVFRHTSDSRLTTLSGAERRALVWSAVWVPACLALTLFLPVRSSLYIVLPSAGAALAAGAVASRTMRLSPRAFARVAAVLVLIAVACVPVYRSRNRRMVREATLASETVAAIVAETRQIAGGGTIAFIDNRAAPTTFEASFGGAVDDAAVVMAGKQWRGLSWPADSSPFPDEVSVVVRLREDGSVSVERHR